MGAPDPENPLFLGFSVLGGGLRPWSQTMVSEGARPWGRGRSGDFHKREFMTSSVPSPFRPLPGFHWFARSLLGATLVVCFPCRLHRKRTVKPREALEKRRKTLLPQTRVLLSLLKMSRCRGVMDRGATALKTSQRFPETSEVFTDFYKP